jgi:hypothetical protein
VEKPDRPAASPCPRAHTSSKPFVTTREYFRGGSKLSGAEIRDTVAPFKVKALVEFTTSSSNLVALLVPSSDNPPTSLGVLGQVSENPTSQDPLGREDEVEINALGQA